MEVRKGKLSKIERTELEAQGFFIQDYTVNGEDYTYIVRPITERSYKE